ncbi:hypothetical protein [Paraburkholderia domus]|uniref:hypothetical protein n=1 Tax=Paraburkholderia domus TaxID=2793075 RepID=UPI0019121FF9|nr:hypothetical protein [Paraburkholderia domus]MBK5061736.1 hypothetical protein [Burkholderia sp. R-70199]CAE6899508.1 hypothetical protein R70199_03609 [Paraburkholderia domus]
MSWEQISTETRPCPCGNGTVTITTEMDDWNRYRESKAIDCPSCRATQHALDSAREQHIARKTASVAQAHALAASRYLDQWLALFEGKSKKSCRDTLFKTDKYPAMGTFYKHVEQSGSLHKYLEAEFHRDFEAALRLLGVNDAEIAALFEQSPSPSLKKD